jgi:hypothetical protein
MEVLKRLAREGLVAQRVLETVAQLPELEALEVLFPAVPVRLLEARDV